MMDEPQIADMLDMIEELQRSGRGRYYIIQQIKAFIQAVEENDPSAILAIRQDLSYPLYERPGIPDQMSRKN